jgi:CTP synthase (UTP-ammonia lyase)
MAIAQPTYNTTTSALVTHVGAYTDTREAAEAATRSAADSAEVTNRNTAIAVVTTMLSTNGKGKVAHGATAGTARPSGFASIEWEGSVEPTNAINGDTWVGG